MKIKVTAHTWLCSSSKTTPANQLVIFGEWYHEVGTQFQWNSRTCFQYLIKWWNGKQRDLIFMKLGYYIWYSVIGGYNDTNTRNQCIVYCLCVAISMTTAIPIKKPTTDELEQVLCMWFTHPSKARWFLRYLDQGTTGLFRWVAEELKGPSWNLTIRPQ